MNPTEREGRVSVVLLGASPAVETRLRDALQGYAVVLNSEPVERGFETCRRDDPDVIIVSVAADADDAFRLITDLAGAGARVICVGPSKDADLLLRTMRAGARDYVVYTDEDELRRATLAQAARPEDEGPLGSVITVFPAKGGVGATAIAVNLAGALQKRGERVCLVDLDFYMGDVLSFLDLQSGYSITDLIANMHRLDGELLAASVTHHRSGVCVLAESDGYSSAAPVAAKDITALLAFLRRHFDRVVVDGLRGFDDHALAALDASSRVFVVVTQDIPAVKNAQRTLTIFRRLGYDDRKVRLVLNRHHKASKITPELISDNLGVPVAAVVGNDFASLIRAINRGVMLSDAAPRSRVNEDVEQLVPLALEREAETTAPRAGLLTRFFSRRGNDESARTADSL